MWFGIPGTGNPIPQPTQEPVSTFPPHLGTVTSPVTFTWEACTDPNATAIALTLENDITGEDMGISYPKSATSSAPLGLAPGAWQAELDFSRGYAGLVNPDGIPYQVRKNSEIEYDFTVQATGNISDHVFHVWVGHGWNYGDPSDPDDTEYSFDLEVQTDATVDLVEFVTPGGDTYQIPNEEHTESGNVETERYFEDGVYHWMYWAYFAAPADLQAAYGDGTYTITVYYVGGGQHSTTVWFGIPGTAEPVPQPTQEPVVTFPPHLGSTTSPVDVTWEACTDPAANIIHLGLENDATDEWIESFYPTSAMSSGSTALSLGPWEADLAFARYYSVADNGDGVSCEIAKYGASRAEFVVVNAGPLPDTFYVNDDVVGEAGSLCTAPGNDANDGFTPDTPMRHIQALLDAYPDIGTGKTVRVDPGTYVENVTIVGWPHSGLTLEGAGPGSSIIDANQVDTCLELDGFASGAIRGFTLQNGNCDTGAGLSCINGSAPTIENMEITNNYANWGGAGIHCEDSSPTIQNCTITGNTAGDSGGGMLNQGSSPTLTDVTFSGNQAGSGGGMLNNNGSSPTLTHVTFSGNQADHSGGGIFNENLSSPTLTGVTFSGNQANSGGGMWNSDSSSPTLTGVTFIGNEAPYGGGGMANDSSSPTLTHVTFSGNQSGWGGGMSNHVGSSPSLTHVTFSGNRAAQLGGGALSNRENSAATLMNSILWGDEAPTGPEIYNEAGSSAAVTYSDVQGGYPGTGNRDTDPLFANPGHWDDNGTPGDPSDDTWVDGDYHLRSQAGHWTETGWVLDAQTSPCIDAGAPDTAPPYDWADEPVPNGQRINMGTYGGTDQASKSLAAGVNPPGLLDIDTRVTVVDGRLNPDGPAPPSLGILALDPNNNGPAVEFAIEASDGSTTRWLRIDASGHVYADSAQADWHLIDDWSNRRLRGLTPGTDYTFHALARSGGDTSILVEVASWRTNEACDVNRSGFVSGLDWAYIKAAILRGGLSWPCDVDDSGALDGTDLGLTLDSFHNR